MSRSPDFMAPTPMRGAPIVPSRQTRPMVEVGGRAAPGAQRLTNTLYSLRVKEIWAFVKKQPISFWAINSYLFFEYVRPQQIYRSIDIIPYAWTSIIIAAVARLSEGKLRRWYPADSWLMAFSCMILISSVLASNPGTSFEHLGDYFAWVLIYFLITNIVTNEQRFLVFMLAFLIHSTKMSQHGVQNFVERGGGFASWGAAGAPGWFQNSGEFGIQMCIFLPLAVCFVQALRPYWGKGKFLLFLFMPISALVSVIASSSRGAVLGLGPVFLWMLLKSKKPVQSILMITLAVAATWQLLPSEQKLRFTEMGDDETSQTRLIYWKRGMEMMETHPLAGVGYKNWFGYTSTHFPMLVGSGGRTYNQLPHNIFIEVGSELGYTGLLLFFGLIGATLYTNSKTRKAAKQLGSGGKFANAMAHGLDAAMIGYLGGGFFVTVFYYPFFWINFAFTVALHHSILQKTLSGSNPSVDAVPQRARSRAHGRA